MIKKVYVDTSVVSGIFDEEFSRYSDLIFQEFKKGIYTPVVSKITSDEIESAPKHVVDKFNELLKYADYVELDDDAIELSRAYLKEGRFSQRMLADTLHIAVATINKVDILASWNFKDIVNLNKILVYNSVNIRYGYPIIEIRSPREIIHE